MAKRNVGTIRQRRPGVFKVTVDISKARQPTYADWHEAVSRLRRSVTVEGTREDAERKLHEMQYEADTGTLPTGKVTLNVWFDYYLREYVAPDRRARTVDDYRRQVRVHIGPALGTMFLTDVQPHHIREFMNRKDKELSRSSIGKLHQILSGAFKEAWRNNLITDNPVAKTPRLSPKAQRPVHALSTDRVQQVIADAEAEGDRWHVLYRLLAFTGLRIGEALALEWQHIDTVGKRVLVRQTTTMAGGGITLGPPKSEKGRRDIPIDDALVAALLRHREAQDAMREQMGAGYTDRGLLFPKVRVGQAGELLANRQVERALRTYGTHPHALRHFFGTQMFEAGASLLRVSRLMGHANVGITAAIYVHPDAAGDRAAIDLLTARMAGVDSGVNGSEEPKVDVEALLASMELGHDA